MTEPLLLKVDADRVVAELTKLATFNDCRDGPPAVTRVVFTDQDLRARDYLRDLYEDAGLQVRVDAVGNTFARWIGKQPGLPIVGTGSHTDAIPFSGMYDGTVGVVGGLEAIRALKRSGYSPDRSIELLMFTSEEPTRFGIGCTGSRVLAGRLNEEQLEQLTDEQGDNYNTVRRNAGFEGTIASAVLDRSYYHAWIELHIEQGPELEARQLPIGVVTAIAAPATMTVDLAGEGGHAGAVLMPRRRDALCAAAEMVQSIESFARKSSSDDLVATVGELSVHPCAVNSIPSRAKFTIDLRDVREDSRNQCKQEIEASIRRIAERRRVTATIDTVNADPPAPASPEIVKAAEQACQASGLPYQKMVSRAYHDSLFIAEIAPIGMLFIPCRNGVSHRPDEYSSPTEIAAGVEILARTMAELATAP